MSTPPDPHSPDTATTPHRRSTWPAARTRGGALRWPAAATLAVATLLAGCAAVQRPMRADLPVAGHAGGAPSSAQVAGDVQVIGKRGRLDAAARTRMLDTLGAQGGASVLNRQLQAMARFGDVNLYAHNEATLLVDGPATFASMFAAIEQAKTAVLLQSYIIEDTGIAAQMAALLARKRAQGVAVAVLYDAVGSIGTSSAFFDALRSADIPTCAINPVNPLKRPGYWEITERDHRKILTVDRGTGYTGGINISTVYSSGSFGHARRPAADAKTDGWRDTQMRLRGPAVAALDDLVRDTWQRQGCQGTLPPAPPPAAAAANAGAGQQVVRIVPASPDEGYSQIYALLLNAIDASTRSVYLTMAYFAPGQEMIDALCDAAQRGVDVQLVLPSVSDFSPVLHAGRSHYKRLLAAGVKVHELQDAVLHAKTAVIDGVVSTVGSSNMDWRSFSSNNEVNAVVLGEDFGDAMVRMFRQDVGNARTITAQAWADRPLTDRVKETVAVWFERLL
jgi:cardiolipin synthase